MANVEKGHRKTANELCSHLQLYSKAFALLGVAEELSHRCWCSAVVASGRDVMYVRREVNSLYDVSGANHIDTVIIMQ